MDQDQNNPGSVSSRVDRKIVERNRRNQMKDLYSKLNSLVPHGSSSREPAVSMPDQLDEATSYIKRLQTSLEKMKEKKDSLMGLYMESKTNETIMGLTRSPQIEVHELGSALEVVLVTGLDCHFIFTEAIRVLHEEGADVVQASFSVVEDTVYHTIHSQGIRELKPSSRAARISERLGRIMQPNMRCN